MSDPDLKSSETDKDEEEWKCERRLGQKNGGATTEHFPARTLLNCSQETTGKTTDKKPALSPVSTESLLESVCMNGEKSGSGGGGGGKSVEAGKETRPAVSSSSIRLPTAAKGTSRNRKEAGIPVGIAVVWQRLAPTASTTPPLNSKACNTMSSTKSSSPPLLVKSTPKIKTLSQSPVPKRPSSTSSIAGGGLKERIKEKWANNNDSAMMTDVKCRPSLAQSVPLNPHGTMTSSKLSERHSPHPYGGSLKYTTDWPATGLNVPTSLSSQNYNAAAVAYLHHQHQLQQQQHIQQQHHLQQQQQLQQLHQMSHASHHFGAHPAAQGFLHHAGYPPPDVLHKYEQYLFQHQAELARQQELQYHHHLHQLHNLSQQQQQQLHAEYDIHRATPIPSPRINIPSPSPTLHGLHYPHATPTATAALWSPEILHHHTSATLSPKSLASTPSPVSTHDSSFLGNPPKANLSAKATTTTVVPPLRASSTSPPESRAATTTDWKDVKINPVPKKVAMSWTTTTVIKKNEKLDSPPVMEGDAVHNDDGKEKSITKKKHDFSRLESLIEKRDDVHLLSPVPIKIDTESCAGNTSESKPSAPNSHQPQPIATGPDYLSNSSCGRSEWPTGVGGSPVDRKPLMNNDPVKIKRETENCDVPHKIGVVADGVCNLVPEMKIKSHVIKCESVNSVADSSVNKSAQVLPTATTKAEPVGAGSSLITNEKKPKKLHSQELKNPQRPVCFAKYHNGVNNNYNDNANNNNSTKPVKEPILTKSFKQEKNTSPIMMIMPGARPMTVADSHQNNNSSSSSSSNDSNYNDSHPMMFKQDKTKSKFEWNSVTSTVTTPLLQPLEQKCDFQSQSTPPPKKCDTDIKIVAPHSLSYSLTNKNNNSDTINDISQPRRRDDENRCRRRRRRDDDDDHDDGYQEQKIIGNICTTNHSNYHHLVNVPLNQSPSSLLASSSVCKKIKSENVGDISSSTACTADEKDTLSRFHHQDNKPTPDYRPIIVQAADNSNHLDLLATVAQQFGNEIGLRKKPFTTTTTVSTVTPATKAFDDEYEFKEESSVPDSNSNKKLEPYGPFSAMNDDEEDADEESLPSLSNSRSTSPFLSTPISSVLAKFPLVTSTQTSGQAPPPPTVAPLVLRIPQVKSGDTPSEATATEKKLKKPKSKRNKKVNENKSDVLLGIVKKKKKKKSSSKPGQDRPKLKKGRANENLLTVTSSSSSMGSSDRAEKAMKKSKKENVNELWQLGELKVAPLKLTKRRSTSDAIVMKKGTGSLVSRDKVKKQRYSIESSSIPCMWSSSPETGMRADAKLDKHSSTKTVDSKKQPSDHTNSDGLAMGQSSRIKQKKKYSKKPAEDEDRRKPSSSLLLEQPSALSQDLSKKKKKKPRKHPDFSCNFHHLGPSASAGTEAGAGCDNERDDDNDTFEPGQEVFSPASSNVENDWAANPTYAVTAIKTTPTIVTDSTPILAPSNTDDNSKKVCHPQQQDKKLKASKLTPANLNNVESAEGTGSGKLQKNLKSYIKSSPSLVQEVTPPKKTKQQNGHHHQHHIKPCLKAEPIRRSSSSPENDFISSGEDEKDTDENVDISTKYSSDTQIEPVVKEKVVEKRVKIESVDEMINDMRVLTEIQGLFYTGKLNALQPPDVYGVTLDNERGAPPHIIFSAEEVLEKCIRELKPEPEALVHGLRICAYWSPQYSGLYPGKVSLDYVPSGDPYNELIPIEFDDGDTGVIKLNEIRLLSPDHPKGEYDPNPLLTLEKKHRKRRHSSAAGSQTSGCTGDHEEADCGEPYCAKIGKLEEEEGGKGKSKLLYWTWKGLSLKKNRSKKDRNKDFFEGIQRGDEVISVGDSALFTSSGNDRPFIGRVEKFWEKKGQKIVKVRWYYHPDEVKTNKSLKGLYAGSLFESPHIDENDVQTIAKKCEVLPFAEFKERVGCLTKWSRNTSQRGIYFVSGFYNPYTYNLQLKDLK